jgi:hypothetical protein
MNKYLSHLSPFDSFSENLIRRCLLLPYLTGSFHSSFIEEYACGLLMTLQKPDGGIRPILCGEVWRHCFVSLAVNVTPILNEAAKLFTSSYDNFIQTAGIRDGASHCAKILSVFYENLEAEKERDELHNQIEQIEEQVHPKRARTHDAAGDAHEMLAEVENWDTDSSPVDRISWWKVVRTPSRPFGQKTNLLSQHQQGFGIVT